jgi:hypothetical protein
MFLKLKQLAMDEIISKLKTPEECRQFVVKYSDLVRQARQRAIELRASSHEAEDIVEYELYQALYAYEDILSEKNNRRTRANRTWQMVKHYGIKLAAERAVNRNADAMGYKVLVGMGLQGLTFESVIVKYPDYFSNNAVKQAHKRLEELRRDLEPTLWAMV